MSEAKQTTMLIAYDGSPESRRALEYAAALLRPRRVEILTAWEPMHRQAARAVSVSGLRQADFGSNAENEDPAYVQGRATCREGVTLAQSLGLEARAHMVESATAIWSAIVDAAKELRPDVIVTGTRAISGLKSLWQSSTADNVIHNSGIPVFVVPPLEDMED
ncbi:Universal stress protein family protein [Corynebacterium occultum]|uniref:Universal stress protein family protein n=1 Tax=Corynebacterium occultum TaxID=2675219 RepID=A0A6B8VSC8_9CORY|nr:universal stress protein [Corynebacterium occultum]QGU08492.1 Universal stress protein family protein [Corynebacterium occultum]